MTDARTSRQLQSGGHAGRSPDMLIHVELIWIGKQTEHWIRFGKPTGERIIDRRRRIVSFTPGSIFALVRWAANDHGTALSRIDIVRAPEPGQSYQTLPYVQPGGQSLLRIEGWSKVQRVLQIVDAIKAYAIDPCDVPPDYWHHVHNRLTARQRPRVYTPARHAAWIKRRKVGQ